jgi:hypothetical protein
MSTVFNAIAVPAHSSQTAVLNVTPPFRGIEIIQQQTLASVVAFGCKVSYQVSMDGGVTFSDPQPVGHECNPSIPNDVNKTSILIYEVATNVKFTVYNTGTVACSSFTLQAATFA